MMKIEWFNHGDNSSAVTIYENNICLNKQASNYFYRCIYGSNRNGLRY
mgnify:CR=1 FL=1